MRSLSTETEPTGVLRFGVFELDPRAGELRKSGTLVKLQPQPLKVLALLASRQGELVTREEIQQQVWGGETFVDFEQGLNYCIRQIRDALGDDADSPRYVETLPRRGYRFLAPVTGAQPQAAVPAAEEQPSRQRTTGFRWIVAVTLVVVLGVAGNWLWRRTLSKPRIPTDRKAMLVVLPFENLSNDPEQEYFSEGLTDEMITQLGALAPKRLGVIARTSAMRYKNTEKTAQEIGRELGVDYILEGTVRREGQRVRITTQLIQVSDQTHLWAESHERELASVFEIQRDVSQRVAQSLALELLPAPRKWSSVPDAHEAYLRGRYFSQRGSAGEAARSFRQAIEADPNYAAAYAGLANTLVFAAPAAKYMPHARDAAQKALELDDSLSDAHSALGTVKFMYEWDWPAAEKSFHRAFELDASNAEAHLRYSNYLAAMGRMDKALVEARLAQQSDPLSPIIGQSIGRYYAMLGQYDRAIELYKKTLELDPNFRWSVISLSFAYEAKGDYDQWLAYQKRARVLFQSPPGTGDEMEQAYREGGYPAAMRRLNQMYEEEAREDRMASATLAINYSKLGDKEKALYWLERAYESHTRDLIYLNVMPEYDPIRNDPRFQAVVRKIGLPTSRAAR